MRYLLWILKFALFIVVVTFAAKNTDLVTVRYYLGIEWQAPLILALLVFFCLGAAAGVAASLAHLFRQRRELVALRRELRNRGRADGEAAPAIPTDAG